MPIAGVVENMSAITCGTCGTYSDLFGSGGGLELAQAADAPHFGQVPLDRALWVAEDEGTPVVRRDPEASSAGALVALAGALPVVRRSLAGKALPLSVVNRAAAETV
jgi:ATP-binding protein involved in chromosome partitioning